MIWPFSLLRRKTQNQRGYAICTTPRSGSNYVCQILSSTGTLGKPLEYFNGPGRRYFDDPAFPDDPQLQVQRILSDGATPNGIYGLKLFPFQLDVIQEQIKWTKLLPDMHHLHLRRGDMLGQAISWSKAIQTVQYRHHQEAKGEPHYDASHILKCLHDIARLNARWDVYFAVNGIVPLKLMYEDFLVDPQGGVDSVAQFLKIERMPLVDLAKVTLQRQSDDLSVAWRQQFLIDEGDPDRILELMP